MNADRVKEGLIAFIRSVFPRIDYLALYPAKVVVQNADGSVDVLPDDPRFPSYQSIPIRYGVPGFKATVSAGARVLLGFAAADPSQPYVALWEDTSPSLVFRGGTKAVARVDDTVNDGTLSLTGSGSTITLTYTPPSGAPTTVTLALAGGATVSGAGLPIALSGKINSGNSDLKA